MLGDAQEGTVEVFAVTMATDRGSGQLISFIFDRASGGAK